jgi:hypothetical protein
MRKGLRKALDARHGTEWRGGERTLTFRARQASHPLLGAPQKTIFMWR